MVADRLILTPGDPGFYETLYGSRPPGWQQTSEFAAFIVREDMGGVMVPASERDLDEYLGGGEHDEVMGEDDDMDESWLCVPEPEMGFFFT